MANASSKKMGAGAQGKHSGTGAMTDIQEELIGENDVLSNRDKHANSDMRGMDGKGAQTDQYQDHAHNRQKKE